MPDCETKILEHNKEKFGSATKEEVSPYRVLFIYYLKGVVQEKDETSLGPDFIGNWVEGRSSFLFFSRPCEGKVARLLEIRGDLELMDEYRFTYEEWQGGGMDPLKVADFVIVPPWVNVTPVVGEKRILLDPGVVFGNGLHPTTRDCLKALSLAYQRKPFLEVIDIGTGTGVLALAAALLGAEHVTGADLNPLCAKTAQKNVELNNMEGRIRVVNAQADELASEPADMVVANIHFDVISQFMKEREFHYGERFIISGLMRTQAWEAEADLVKKHLSVLKKWDHDMTWFTLLAEKE